MSKTKPKRSQRTPHPLPQAGRPRKSVALRVGRSVSFDPALLVRAERVAQEAGAKNVSELVEQALLAFLPALEEAGVSAKQARAVRLFPPDERKD